MTRATALLQASLGRDVHWSMHLSVTFGTPCQACSMNLIVTCLTFGKDFFIFYPSRAIDVEFYVALPAIYPVFTTLRLYKVIEAQMALPTLFWSQGLNL